MIAEGLVHHLIIQKKEIINILLNAFKNVVQATEYSGLFITVEDLKR